MYWNDEIEAEFAINHAEADTVLLTLYNQLPINGFNGTVIIDSEDTDVYVHAAYVSQGKWTTLNEKEEFICGTARHFFRAIFLKL